MIDNMDNVERLQRKLEAALPIPVRAPPGLVASLRGSSSSAKIAADCRIDKIFYMGDEGGISCEVSFGDEEKKEVFIISITQLAFDPRLPLAHDIAAYQKHRIKRIRRENARAGLAAG